MISRPALNHAFPVVRNLTLITAIAVGLAGCGGASGSTGQAAMPQSAGSSAQTGGSAVQLPEFPVPRVPDISSLTASAAKTEKLIAAAGGVPSGLLVTGARCDADGKVDNRTGATVGAADDGSQIVNDVGIKEIAPDGSGQVTSDDVIYEVNADGSGQITSGDAVLQVNADGSGQFTSGDVIYEVKADGSGQVTSGKEVYQVNADGSGHWTSSDGGIVQNDGNGKGSWTGDQGVVDINGDGTGTRAGEPIKIAPLPKFTTLGSFPKLRKLAPVGKPCGTLIRLNAEVLFDFDQATLRPEAKKELAAIAKALPGAGSAINVNAHTDSMGADAYNLDLSTRRAQTVIAALTDDKVTATMTPHGYGKTQPVAPNTLNGKDNPAGRQLNRRVEIVIPTP